MSTSESRRVASNRRTHSPIPKRTRNVCARAHNPFARRVASRRRQIPVRTAAAAADRSLVPLHRYARARPFPFSIFANFHIRFGSVRFLSVLFRSVPFRSISAAQRRAEQNGTEQKSNALAPVRSTCVIAPCRAVQCRAVPCSGRAHFALRAACE